MSRRTIRRALHRLDASLLGDAIGAAALLLLITAACVGIQL